MLTWPFYLAMSFARAFQASFILHKEGHKDRSREANAPVLAMRRAKRPSPKPKRGSKITVMQTITAVPEGDAPAAAQESRL